MVRIVLLLCLLLIGCQPATPLALVTPVSVETTPSPTVLTAPSPTATEPPASTSTAARLPTSPPSPSATATRAATAATRSAPRATAPAAGTAPAPQRATPAHVGGLPTTPPTEPLSAAQTGWRRFTSADGLPSDDLLTVAIAIQGTSDRTCAPPNGVWVGTNGAGLAWWDGAQWATITRANSGNRLTSDIVQSILFAPGLRAFFGTSAGLSTYCPNSQAPWSANFPWRPPNASIQAMTRVGSAFWFAHPTGLDTMYIGQWRRFTTADGLGNNDVRALVGDLASNRLWAGTWDGGITVFEGAARDWSIRTTYTVANSGLGSNRVTALAWQTGGVLWVGLAPDPANGRPGGVSRFDENATGEKWQTFTTANGTLPSNDVRAIAVDTIGDVWVATGAGLAVRRAASGRWTHYTVATTGGALGSDDVTGIAVAPNNTRWFSTRAGLTRLVGTPPTPGTPVPATPTTAALATPNPNYPLYLPSLMRSAGG